MHLFSLPLLCAAPILVAAQHAVFHGTSVVILPKSASASPANSSFLTSNFFSYSAPEGYISYGWWLPAGKGSNTSHCKPDSTDYHWVEFANGTCNWDTERCLYSVENIPRREPRDVSPPPIPRGPVRYVVRPLHVGNGVYGEMALSFVDEDKIKAYGIGTRQVLSGEGRAADGQQCEEALAMVRRLVEEMGPSLGFEITDPCGGGMPVEDDSAGWSDDDLQAILEDL